MSVNTDVRLQRFRMDGSREVDENHLVRVIAQNSPECDLSAEELLRQVSSEPGGFTVCNGHDLAAAVNRVLRDDFSVRGQTADSIEKLLRLGMTDEQLHGWGVVRRLRLWQIQMSVVVLR